MSGGGTLTPVIANNVLECELTHGMACESKITKSSGYLSIFVAKPTYMNFTQSDNLSFLYSIMTKQINTSMRLLFSCGCEDIYCSASEGSLNIPSKEFQRPPLNMVNETLRKNKNTKQHQHQRNCQMHQLNSSSDCVLEKEETAIISHDDPATKRESSNEEVADKSLNMESPPRNRGRRQERRCSVTKFSLEDDICNTVKESERSEKSCAPLTRPKRGGVLDQRNVRPLTEPLSRLTSSRRLRPCLQRLWVSVANIHDTPIQESKKHSQEEDNTCQEDDCPSIEGPRGSHTGGEEPELRTKLFQFSQLKSRSLRAITRPQVLPSWSSFRKLRGIDEKKKHANKESETSKEDSRPGRLLTRSRSYRGHESSAGHESSIQNTNPKRNWLSLGRGGVPSVIKVHLDDDEDSDEENTKSHNEPRSSQPILPVRSTGKNDRRRNRLQRRNSITKFNLDQTTNESFRTITTRRPRMMERRNAVTQFSQGVGRAQAETTSARTNDCCVFVAVPPQISQSKLFSSGKGASTPVFIFAKESLDLAGAAELKRNGMAPNAA
jgi:hypothetical protein